MLGANDGASGVAVVLEIARALPDRLDGPLVHVALFDAEEARGERDFERDGTRGSRQYVRYAREAERRGGAVQGTPPLREIDSMILLDLVGTATCRSPGGELDPTSTSRSPPRRSRRTRPSAAPRRRCPTITSRSSRPGSPPST